MQSDRLRQTSFGTVSDVATDSWFANGPSHDELTVPLAQGWNTLSLLARGTPGMNGLDFFSREWRMESELSKFISQNDSNFPESFSDCGAFNGIPLIIYITRSSSASAESSRLGAKPLIGANPWLRPWLLERWPSLGAEWCWMLKGCHCREWWLNLLMVIYGWWLWMIMDDYGWLWIISPISWTNPTKHQ